SGPLQLSGTPVRAIAAAIHSARAPLGAGPEKAGPLGRAEAEAAFRAFSRARWKSPLSSSVLGSPLRSASGKSIRPPAANFGKRLVRIASMKSVPWWVKEWVGWRD